MLESSVIGYVVRATIDMSEWFESRLVCPQCRRHFDRINTRFCDGCGTSYSSPRDLRAPWKGNTQFSIPRWGGEDAEFGLGSINIDRPINDYQGPRASRDSSELMSEIMRCLPKGGDALDLGCGPRDQVRPLEYAKFRYVGIDYSGSSADLLADAHALPFADNSFDLVLSYAVLEHLWSPLAGLSEVRRVLKPGGWYVGTVSQGEPFHASYNHFTPWGLLAALKCIPGLELRRMWPGPDTLTSLSVMGRYPKLIRLGLGLLDTIHRRVPILAPRKRRWPQRERALDELFRAGSVVFAVERTDG